jgi:hypothetical protein
LPFNALAQSTPILDVHPDTIQFYADFCGGSPMPGDTVFRGFMVANIGDTSMTWTGTAGESWVVFDPMGGGDYDSVMVWIDWDQAPVIFTPPLPGDTLLFETEITIEAPGAENSPKQIVVQLGYTCDPEEYQLLAYPSHFELTAPPDDTLSRYIFVVEAHNANIEFYLSNSSNWLILPEFFAPLVTPDSIEFMISTIGLDPGIYYDTLMAVASEGPDNWTAIPVRLNVSEGGYVLASIPESFSFIVPEGTPILGESLYVYEEYGHSINFWTHNEAYWLYVDTMAASPLYTPRLLTVNIFADTLEPGIYTDTILIYADEFSDSPLLVPVSVIVEGESPEPQVATSPAYIDVIAAPDVTVNRSLHVYEIHGLTVGFIATTQASWMEISDGPHFFTPVNLDISIITAYLEPGFYADTVFIYPDTDSYSFPPVAVPVYLQVSSDAAVVRALPDYFHFILAPGDSVPMTGIFVYEENGQELPFAYEPIGQSSWLDVPTYPYIRTTPDSIHFAINTDSLAPGTYGDSIAIYYPYDDIYGYADVLVPVILTIEDNPPDYYLETSPTMFNFAVNDAGYAFDTLLVYDIYGQNIGFHYYNNSPWLAVNPLGMPPYMTPMAIPVAASAAGLSPGIYTDTIFISSTAWDSLAIPQNLAVPVTMTVGMPYPMGDANGDETVDIGDAVFLINFIFGSGPAPESSDAADANCDDFINVGDVVHIIAYTFRDGPDPGCE